MLLDFVDRLVGECYIESVVLMMMMVAVVVVVVEVVAVMELLFLE
jgi:hypothetical protein